MCSPLIYIVLVNYKNWQDTAECLESLFKLSYANFKVVVVDNDSQNDSIGHLKSWAAGTLAITPNKYFYSAAPVDPKPVAKPIHYQYFPANTTVDTPIDQSRLILVEAGGNLGFAGGNNVGIRLALTNRADFVWLLNNDTVVERESLIRLVDHFAEAKVKKQKLGILGAKLLYYHNPDAVQAILGRYNPLTASTIHIGLNKGSATSFGNVSIGPNDYIVGASMFVSADFIRDTGLMSEDYFLYFEEIDWVKRGKLKGYGIDVCLSSKIYHKEGAAIGGSTKNIQQKSELSDFYSIRNRLIITKKFYPKYIWPVYLSLVGVAINRVRRKQFNRIPLIFRALTSSI